jgi:hypothetical protein
VIPLLLEVLVPPPTNVQAPSTIKVTISSGIEVLAIKVLIEVLAPPCVQVPQELWLIL